MLVSCVFRGGWYISRNWGGIFLVIGSKKNSIHAVFRMLKVVDKIVDKVVDKVVLLSEKKREGWVRGPGIREATLIARQNHELSLAERDKFILGRVR